MQTGRKKIMATGILLLALVLIVFAALTQSGVFSAGHAISDKTTEDPVAPDTADVGLPTGDDPWKELQGLVSAYSGKEGMKYAGTMKLIDDNGDEEKVLEETRFEYQVYGDEFYYSLGPIETVCKNDLVLLADHQNKIIEVSKALFKGKKTKQPFDMDQFRKLLEESHANAVVTQRGSQKVLTIDSIQHPDIQGYRIYYDPVTYRITRMLIGMARPFSLDDAAAAENTVEQPEDNETAPAENDKEVNTNEKEEDGGFQAWYYYLELVYSQIQPLSVDRDGFAPEKKFISFNKNNIQLTPAFRGYNLVNDINNEEENKETTPVKGQ